MAHVLGIPSPKDDIDGSMVRDVYYKGNDLERIIHYCDRDVISAAQGFLRLSNEMSLTEDQIFRASIRYCPGYNMHSVKHGF